MISSRNIGRGLATPVTLVLLVAFAVPMAVVVLLSMHAYSDPFGPLLRPPSTAQYAMVLGDFFYLRVLLETLTLAGGVTALSVIIGYPLALWLVSVPAKWRALAFVVILIPLLTNVVVRSLGIVLLLAPDGILNGVLGWLGIGPFRNMLYNYGAVCIALAQVFMPYVVLALYDVLQGTSPRVKEAAESLGASPSMVFWTVRFPMALPGLRAGIVVVFLMASTAYVSATILGGGRVLTSGMLVYREAITNLSYPIAAALTLVMTVASLAFSAVVLLVFRKLTPWTRAGEGRANSSLPAIPVWLVRGLDLIGPLISRGLLVIAIILLLLPLYLVVMQSFNDVPQASSAKFVGFTLKWYEIVLQNGNYTAAFLNSVRLAVASTLISLAVSIPAAFALVRYRFPGLNGLAVFWALPLSLPGVAIGVGMLQLLSIFFRLPPFLGLLAVHVAIVIPFCISLLVASVLQLDRAQEEAAASLGANGFQRFFRIILPGLAPGMAAASIMAFLTSFGEVTVTSFLTTARMTTLPVRIYADSTFMLEPTVHAVSAMTMLLTLIALFVLNKFLRLDRLYAR
ncbi:ABC transporter permease protein [Ketogulonicigenium vulgare WSH-001]|uniref:ABC transporter permease protein n=1 Tax=Ketogulonicigenium vulgare (strain WSH-001) TaxID=759362 RepID=F9Y760_KETVW|nr:ABC transporter permease subunit [Ketogulonicigenium vulgare]AEM42250.1 ABC transporter permease protein [Ketogulonicigenium vulgare WSH-001]